MKTMLCCLLLATLFHAGQSTNERAQSFRIIPIQKRETGYSNFSSIAFMSKNDLDSFLKNATTQPGWCNRQEFDDALRSANVDFTKEALVLLRHTEGSGSVQVTFETPVLQDGRLLCEIKGRPIPPGYGGSADMAYYCLAVVVSKSAVSQVELQAVEGGFSARRLAPIVLPIIEKEPARQLLQPPVKQDQIPDCPTVSVSCPAEVGGGNKPIRFIASIIGVSFIASAIGGKPRNEVSYNWSVSKGTISRGQGTAVIEVTAMDPERLTATVEISGLEPSCNRVASCSVGIP